MERFDYSPTYHIFCYLLTVESFLLFAAIAQTKSHFVGAHGPLARAFGLVFLFQSLGALFTALAIEFEPWAADFVLHVVRFLAKFSIGAAIAAAVPAASAIAFPEMGNALKKFGMSLLATVIIIYTAYLSAEFAAVTMGIPFIKERMSELFGGGALAGKFLVIVACGFRVFFGPRRPAATGAPVLALGIALSLAIDFVWLRLDPLCDVSQKHWSCPLPHWFDHNALLVLGYLVTNLIVVEGVLQLMLADCSPDIEERDVEYDSSSERLTYGTA